MISSRPAVVVLVLLLVLTCVCTVVTLIYVVSEMRTMRGQLATLSQSVSSQSKGKISLDQRQEDFAQPFTFRGKNALHIEMYYYTSSIYGNKMPNFYQEKVLGLTISNQLE